MAYQKAVTTYAISDGQKDFVHKSVRAEAAYNIPFGAEEHPDLMKVYQHVQNSLAAKVATF